MSLGDLKEAILDAYDGLSEKIPFLPAIIIVVLALAAWLVFFAASPEESAPTGVSVTVKNQAGAEMRGATIIVRGLDREISFKTDNSGKASFEAPLGKTIEILASKDGYSGQKKTVTVRSGLSVSVTLPPLEPVSGEVTLTFVGPDRQKLAGKEVRVRLGCTGTGAFETDSYTTANGELTITPPQDCGGISVIASADGFETKTASVLGREEVIRLEGIETPKGSIEIIARDADTGRFAENLGIKLYREDNSFTGLQGLTSFGRTTFRELETGPYTAVIEDEGGEYGPEQLSFTIRSTESIVREILVSRDVKLRAKITATNRNNNAKIEGALVTIYDSVGSVFAQKETNQEGEALFPISRNGTYSYLAEKENHLPSQRKEFTTTDYERGSTQEFTAEMEPCTPEKCGSLIVRVVDEKGNPVENAGVRLLNEEGFIVTAHTQKSTDYNGFAGAFTGLGEGTYTVLAQKYPAEAKSEPVTINPLEENKILVTLVVGEGTIFVTARDTDNEGISFAEAEIYTGFGDLLGIISLDAEGFGTLRGVKADKSVYAAVKKDGYSSYFTALKQVVKDESLFFNTVLEREITGEKPKIELLGVYTKQGKAVNTLTAGQRFDARFSLTVPHGTVFPETGAFIRAGDRETLEKDSIQIQETNSPLSSIARGTAFKPPDGTPELTNNNAKWVSLVWKEPEPGTYEFEAELKVSEGTSPGTFLPIFYRAWGLSGARYLRDPFDAELGEAPETAEKTSLYAESYQKALFEGISELCFAEFCTSERVLDIEEGLAINQPYKVKTFAPYEVEFTITNNSKKTLDSAFLEIRNTLDGTTIGEDIQITAYAVTNADSQEFISEGASFETERISLGEFRQNKTVSGTLLIQPKTENQSSVQFRIISEQEVAFEKLIPFTPFSLDELDLRAGPEVLPAFVEFDLNVFALHASGREEGFGVEGAKIVVIRIAPDRSETNFTATTNANGEATITIPASSPGTRLVIRAEKTGLGFGKIEKSVSENVVSFSPEKLSFSLKREGKETEQKELTIKNLIQTPLVIKRIVTSGNFRGLLDEDRMDAFLAASTGLAIRAGESETIGVLSALGREAEFLDEPVTARGKIIAEFETAENTGAGWVSEIWFDTAIGLGELPENRNCLVLSNNSWRDSTLQGKSSIELELENNCVGEDGGLIQLDNLQATINWTGEQGIIGLTGITVVNPETGEVSSEILQPGLWTRLFENIEPGQPYTVRLEFASKPGSVGKTAKFTITIDGQIQTNAGFEFIGSGNSINSEILIVNLDQCIKSTTGFGGKDILELGQSDSATFTINTTECGNLPLNFRLCHNDTGCRGGTEEGGINVRPLSFSLDETAREQEITVGRESIPGIYGIGVEVQPLGGSWRKAGEVLVSLDPLGANTAISNPFGGGFGDYSPGLFANAGPTRTLSGEPFSLSKYDFIIKGEGATDTATLTNRFLSESVPVNASACDWGTAEQLESQSPFNFANAGLGAAAGGLLGVKPSMSFATSAAKKAGQQAGKAIDQGVDQSKEVVGQSDAVVQEAGNLENARDAMTNAKDATETSLTAVDSSVKGTVVTSANEVQISCDVCSASAAATTAVSTLTALDSSKQAAFKSIDTISNTVNQVSEAADSANTLASSADTELGEAAQTAMPDSTSKIPGACEQAQEAFASSKDLANKSLESVKDVADQAKNVSENAANQASQAVSDLSSDLASTRAAVESVNTAIGSCTSFTTTRVVQCNAAKAKAVPAIEAVATGQILDASNKISGLGNAVDGVGSAADGLTSVNDKLLSQQDKLIGNIDGIQSSCQDFTAQSAPTGNAADFRWGRFGGMMGTYMGLGFLGGGLIGNLFSPGDDQNPCDERQTQNVQDWVINLAPGINPQIGGLGKNALQQIFSGNLSLQSLLRNVSLGANLGDTLPIQTDSETLNADWNFRDARSMGQFDQQTVGVIFENNGLPSNKKAVYSVVSFRALRHVHAKPTIIPRGIAAFGQFRVPDLFVQPVNQKFHLRFETGEEPTQLTEINFDAASCSVGTQIGYTGAEVKPRVLLDWSWEKFQGYRCDQGNENYVYCDATQFSIETSYKLEVLRKFLERNRGVLSCPENPAETILEELTRELDAFGLLETATPQQECWVPMSTLEMDGRPALDFYVEDNLDKIQWLPEHGISNRQDLLGLLTFNSYLIQDGYPQDFKKDFVRFYTDNRFFDAPDFFTRTGTGSGGGEYGLGRLFETDSIRFNKKYLEDRDAQLSGPGLYRVHIRADFTDNWKFFGENGEPAAVFNIELSLLKGPEVDSPFYRLPFNGLVGLEGDTLERDGYGISYQNGGDELVTISNELAPAKTFGSLGSNALTEASVQVERNLFRLNTSPQTRGKILEVRKLTGSNAAIVFRPTQATPLMMKVTRETRTEEPFSAFYRLLESDVPVDTGNTLAYWSGAGACLDFTKVPVTEKFFETPDRAATEDDSPADFRSVYAVDWQNAQKTGDVYLRTIIYADPLKDTVIRAVRSDAGVEFLTADERGQSVALNGVTGMPRNSFSGGTEGTINSIADIFDLIEGGEACITSTGNTTSFWWNPKTVYTAEGTQRSISELTNSLEAGNTCIG